MTCFEHGLKLLGVEMPQNTRSQLDLGTLSEVLDMKGEVAKSTWEQRRLEAEVSIAQGNHNKAKTHEESLRKDLDWSEVEMERIKEEKEAAPKRFLECQNKEKELAPGLIDLRASDKTAQEQREDKKLAYHEILSRAEKAKKDADM